MKKKILLESISMAAACNKELHVFSFKSNVAASLQGRDFLKYPWLHMQKAEAAARGIL